MPRTLDVRLGETPVGTMTNLDGDYNLFAFDDAYRETADRPILSQSLIDRFEEPILVVPRVHRLAPPFFSNLLPEEDSALRGLIARQRGFERTRDYPFLRALGSELPGAVILAARGDDADHPAESDTGSASGRRPIRFSLAGMQLKFSASFASGRFSITKKIGEEDWIVKMPAGAYPVIACNEFAIMSFARAIGLAVPEIALRPIDAVVDLPDGLPSVPETERTVFAIQRFDRASGGRRIHAEDFNQIAGQAPNDKYEHRTTSFVASTISELCDRDDVDEFVKRLVFGICVGNGDMHLKNCGIVYPDGRRPKLSPMYDFVCTRRYVPHDELALTVGGERSFTRIDAEAMRSFARLAEISASRVETLVRETVDRVRDAWPGIRAGIEDRELVAVLEANFDRVPLMNAGRRA